MPSNDLSGWNVTTLTKFIQDILRNDPVRFSSVLTVEDLTVVSKLTVKDEAEFPVRWHVIGGTGEPAFAASWTHYGAPYAKAAYLKDVSGFVHLAGVIKNGTVGSAAFTLPPGLRPPVDLGPIAVISNGALGRVDIKADGTVTPMAPSNNASVVLDNITFKAA